jgi:hypothetical protein
MLNSRLARCFVFRTAICALTGCDSSPVRPTETESFQAHVTNRPLLCSPARVWWRASTKSVW